MRVKTWVAWSLSKNLPQKGALPLRRLARQRVPRLRPSRWRCAGAVVQGCVRRARALASRGPSRAWEDIPMQPSVAGA